MRHPQFVLLLALFAIAPAQAAEPAPLQICTGDDDAFPWQLNDRPGLALLLMRRVEQRLGLRFVVTPKPWKRCLLELNAGVVDAAFKASYSPERAAEGAVYPMQGDKPDVDKRLLIDSYSLFRLKGSKVEWDGQQLRADGVLGAQSGFSVVAQLKGMGAQVDDGNRWALATLQKLAAGRIVAAALQTQEGETQLELNPELGARIERIGPVLVEKPYYLVFSRAWYGGHETQARAIWATIAKVRESAEYKAQVRDFR